MCVVIQKIKFGKDNRHKTQMRKPETSTNYSSKVMFFMALCVDNSQDICNPVAVHS